MINSSHVRNRLLFFSLLSNFKQMKKVIAVFDIGKTNKKVLLFDEHLQLAYQNEQKFKTTVDEDGDECDDLPLMEEWMKTTLTDFIQGDEYDIKAVNFSTYGASLAFIGEDGERLTPIYNYLKEISESIQTSLFESNGGEAEFCRKTASPALGVMLNSGIQLLWLKDQKQELYAKVSAIMHFPQYLSYVLTGEVVAESTSIGCHTFMWDYDSNNYHSWLADAGITLPIPLANTQTIISEIAGQSLPVGIGIHDSSSSLVPYIRGSKEKFLLISTGTWCINMNPFNHTPLTAQQLKDDCLCYMSIEQSPVKSSRLFMGHIHDVNSQRMTDFFNVPEDEFKRVKTDKAYLLNLLKDTAANRQFFVGEMPADYIDLSVDLSQFKDYAEAYHQFMFDLTLLDARSIDMVSTPEDGVENFFVSGGFARNEMFVRLLANLYPDKCIYTSEVDNSSAMGAALVVWDKMSGTSLPDIDLGLKAWKGF